MSKTVQIVSSGIVISENSSIQSPVLDRFRNMRKIAEVLHELDIKDEKFRTPEAKGIEDILSGIRKTVKDDNESLGKGMAIFEMLYVSKE